jgi:hypothetical protein
MTITAADLAKELQGEVIGDGSTAITGFAPADTAKAGDLTFAENEAYFAKVGRDQILDQDAHSRGERPRGIRQSPDVVLSGTEVCGWYPRFGHHLNVGDS